MPLSLVEAALVKSDLERGVLSKNSSSRSDLYLKIIPYLLFCSESLSDCCYHFLLHLRQSQKNNLSSESKH